MVGRVCSAQGPFVPTEAAPGSPPGTWGVPSAKDLGGAPLSSPLGRHKLLYKGFPFLSALALSLLMAVHWWKHIRKKLTVIREP